MSVALAKRALFSEPADPPLPATEGVLSGFVGTENFLSVFGYPDSGLVGTMYALPRGRRVSLHSSRAEPRRQLLTRPSWMSHSTSIYNIGCLFGAIAASFIGDRIGRKKTIVS